MCYTVSPVRSSCLCGVWHGHVLVVHAAVKCDFSTGRVSQWAGLPVTLHNIFIRADSRLYGSQSGAAMEPKEQEEKQALFSGQRIDRGSKFKVNA